MSYERINFGIHSIAPKRITDGLPYGIMKVLGGGTLALSADFQELFGGSEKFSWAVESTTISAEWSATVKSMKDFMFELFLGATVTKTSASATGTVGDLSNVLNESVFDAATGIASVAAKAGSEEDLKDGIYIIKAVSATTVDIYALTDIEFNKEGASNTLEYLSDDLKINSSPLTITTAGATTEIVGLGVELTGGSGTIAMTENDTARFSVRSAHGGLSVIDIGLDGTTFPEHSQLCLAQKRANGDTFELELYRVIASGMPIPFTEQEFAVPELSMRVVKDLTKGKLASIRAKRGLASI